MVLKKGDSCVGNGSKVWKNLREVERDRRTREPINKEKVGSAKVKKEKRTARKSKQIKKQLENIKEK